MSLRAIALKPRLTAYDINRLLSGEPSLSRTRPAVNAVPTAGARSTSESSRSRFSADIARAVSRETFRIPCRAALLERGRSSPWLGLVAGHPLCDTLRVKQQRAAEVSRCSARDRLKQIMQGQPELVLPIAQTRSASSHTSSRGGGRAR